MLALYLLLVFADQIFLIVIKFFILIFNFDIKFI